MSQQLKNQIQNKQTDKTDKSNKKEISLIATQAYQGPIPPPQLMEGYAKIDPSFPDRIFKLVEKNLDEQYKHQKKMDILQYCGWGSAFIITLLAMGIGAYLLLNDKDIAGFAYLLGAALPTLIIIFTNKEKNKK